MRGCFFASPSRLLCD